MIHLARFAINIGLIAVAGTIALVLAELVVRVVAPQKTMFPRYVLSDEYAIELPPNAEIHHRRGTKWKYVYTTNALGRRGPLVPIASRYESTNVVVLGDSFAFGIGVADGDEFPSILAAELGRHFAVINGGMAGWGIDSEIKWFHDVGMSYDPAVVVLQFTANDPNDSGTGVAAVEAGQLVFFPYQGTKPKWQQLVSSSWLLQNSHIFSSIRSMLNAPPRGQTGAAIGNSSATEGRETAPELRYNEYLRAFARDLADRSVDLFFVSVTHRSAEGVYRYDVDRFSAIRQQLDSLGRSGLVRFVDLPLQELGEYPPSPEGHQWSADHHRVVGRELARAILNR